MSRWEQGAFAVPEAYAEAVWRAGGRPVLLTAHEGSDLGEADEEALLRGLDGLLLAGGGDVDPFLYDTEPHETLYGQDRDRDLLEMAILREAVASRVPVLAICRGIQLANVALGGTLHQHVPDLGTDLHGSPRGEGYTPHEVEIAAGSRLAEICGAGAHVVQSSHHQAIDILGDGFTITAETEDGIVEGIERADSWFVGVQWHPEVAATGEPEQQALFDAFVSEAASR